MSQNQLPPDDELLAGRNSDSQLRPVKKRSSSSADSFAVSFSSFELRLVLASVISWDANTSVATIQGDGGANWAQVDLVNDGVIGISADGATMLELAENSVVRIDFFGGAGDDVFTNFSIIPVNAHGEDGNDTLTGGSAIDNIFGGAGNDILAGGGGNDFLNGGSGNDTLNGDTGNDQLVGSSGNDLIYGGSGDDILSGSWDNDVLWGEAGNDVLQGYTGTDYLYGGDGRDYCYGQAGDDFVYGGAEVDRVRGNNGNDFLYGDDGNDWMMGDDGNDVMYAGTGDDVLWGWTGADLLYGGSGIDSLYGQADNDTSYGDDGDDAIDSGSGDDISFGGNGNDWLQGSSGNDLIRGQGGADILRGGAGNDSLIGGDSNWQDILYGDGGMDRLLTQGTDYLVDLTTADAEIRFIDRTSAWNDAELESTDVGLGLLQSQTGNTLLLKDTLTSSPLSFYKYDSLGNASGINWLEWTTTSVWTNGQWVHTTTYNREIRIADWDETNSFYNDWNVHVTIHEIGHNWDSQLEMNAFSSGMGAQWSNFISVSDWRDVNPNSGSFSQSGDGQWWYDSSAPFYDAYGRTNPNEDFSTTWELYFDPSASAGDLALMADKLAVIDQMMAIVAAG